MSVQEKITDLNKRIAQIDTAGQDFRSSIKSRVETIKATLGSLGERIKVLDSGAGDAREEVTNLLKSNEELREQVSKITSERDELQKTIDSSDIEGISNKIQEYLLHR